MKKCGGCKKIKEDEEFSIKKGALRASFCKQCKREYNAIWYERNKDVHCANVLANKEIYKSQARQLLRELKSKPCTDCKNSYHWFAMDFDHVRGKTLDISRCIAQSWCLDRIKGEIEKCEVVCAVCHRLRTIKRVESGKCKWNELV